MPISVRTVDWKTNLTGKSYIFFPKMQTILFKIQMSCESRGKNNNLNRSILNLNHILYCSFLILVLNLLNLKFLQGGSFGKKAS